MHCHFRLLKLNLMYTCIFITHITVKPLFKDIIGECTDWNSFKARISSLDRSEKGRAFEWFVKCYLQTHPDYTSILKEVWLFEELTQKIRSELSIPSNDQGIDLVAQTTRGDYWAIQCKYLEDEDQRLSHRSISTFASLAFAVSGKFSFGLVCTTAERFPKGYSKQNQIAFRTSEIWQNLTSEQFDNIRRRGLTKPAKIKPYEPRTHQQKAIRNAVKHFVGQKQRRGKLIHPCGAGKSLTGFWIANVLKARSVLVAVPSLALIRQTLQTWLREAVATGIQVDWVCVCSDASIGKDDDTTVLVQDLGIPSITDESFLAGWLRRKDRKIKIVFVTYQSGEVVARAAASAKFRFDLGILDEAHKTVGQKNKLFSHLLYDENISIQKRVFMTATERRYLGSSDEIASMDNPAIYGDTFELLTFKKALEIRPSILSDYKIITVAIGEGELKELLSRNAFVKPDKGVWNEEVELQTLMALVALRKAMRKYPIRHAVSYHTSIARAKAFSESQNSINDLMPDFGRIESFHVSGVSSTADRTKTISAFRASERALITNSRCLTEGVDVPEIDCVLFADPKKSTIDIVQATGRVLRVLEGKKFGYVIIPILIDPVSEVDSNREVVFADVLNVVRSLASNDERIIEYFKLQSERPLEHGSAQIIDSIFEFYSESLSFSEFARAVELVIWSNLAKITWRPFEEARAFSRALNLKTGNDWHNYCRSGKKPFDIPSAPDTNTTYKQKWQGWGDWLGTGAIATHLRVYRSFEEARSFAHTLNFKVREDWQKYCFSGAKPEDIPSNPSTKYKGSWQGWGDWLGTERIATQLRRYRPFQDAREFVHQLRLQSGVEWVNYCKSVNKPDDIPYSAHTVYAKEWRGMGDWLGTGKIANQVVEYRPFPEARKFIHFLNLKTQKDWSDYSKSAHRPKDIPSDPRNGYKDEFKSMGDWLGTGAVATFLKVYQPFSRARQYARSLNLKTKEEWMVFSKSGAKPEDIPSTPARAYKEDWKGWGDWLGTGRIANQKREYRPFEEARWFVHTLKLKNYDEWVEYCKSGKKPDDIPANIFKAYKADWKGLGDWLGTGRIANQYRTRRSFADARKYIHTLGLKNQKEWQAYCKSGLKPSDIPSYPNETYEKEWKGLGDWLGTGKIANSKMVFLPFKEARNFARGLRLETSTQWMRFCESGKKPDNIPVKVYRTYRKEWRGWADWLGRI